MATSRLFCQQRPARPVAIQGHTGTRKYPLFLWITVQKRCMRLPDLQLADRAPPWKSPATGRAEMRLRFRVHAGPLRLCTEERIYVLRREFMY